MLTTRDFEEQMQPPVQLKEELEQYDSKKMEIKGQIYHISQRRWSELRGKRRMEEQKDKVNGLNMQRLFRVTQALSSLIQLKHLIFIDRLVFRTNFCGHQTEKIEVVVMEEGNPPVRRWEDLNIDMLVKIFQSFDLFQLISIIPQVCPVWQSTYSDQRLWKTLDLPSTTCTNENLTELDESILEKASRLDKFLTCMSDSCIMCQRTRNDEGFMRWYKYADLLKVDEELVGNLTISKPNPMEFQWFCDLSDSDIRSTCLAQVTNSPLPLNYYEHKMFDEMLNSNCPKVFTVASFDAPVEILYYDVIGPDGSKVQLFYGRPQIDMSESVGSKTTMVWCLRTTHRTFVQLAILRGVYACVNTKWLTAVESVIFVSLATVVLTNKEVITKDKSYFILDSGQWSVCTTNITTILKHYFDYFSGLGSIKEQPL
ncbi:hypothetical protein H5410_001864 [Solanum commersonii]|uniref:F-box domain-containing protein n=1 Tax=Solanum commersonii TaxID=4109 RepID=A0A9J6B0T2_SOLCO|nr:hypothetical protein H5410_001864 [Solanum commersonii]